MTPTVSPTNTNTIANTIANTTSTTSASTAKDYPHSHSDSHSHLRWIVLSLNCFLLMGNYYAYDNPAALRTMLAEYLDESVNDPTDADPFDYLFGLFYSVYSLPNIILPFLSGYWIDHLGPSRVLLFLSGCVCVGQGGCRSL